MGCNPNIHHLQEVIRRLQTIDPNFLGHPSSWKFNSAKKTVQTLVLEGRCCPVFFSRWTRRLVVNGVIAPINGRKWMGMWDYNPRPTQRDYSSKWSCNIITLYIFIYLYPQLPIYFRPFISIYRGPMSLHVWFSEFHFGGLQALTTKIFPSWAMKTNWFGCLI